MRSLSLLGILILNIGAIAAREPQQDLPQFRSDDGRASQAVQQIVKSIYTFSEYFTLGSTHLDEGTYIRSPLSAYLAMAMASFGVRGGSEMELHRALGLNNSTLLEKNTLREFIDGLTSSEAMELQILNRVFISWEFDINIRLLDSMIEAFHASLQLLAPPPPPPPRMSMFNAWSLRNTHNRIDAFVENDPLHAAPPAFVFANALYFNGTWLHPASANTYWSRYYSRGDGSFELFRTMKTTVFRGETPSGELQFFELPFMKNADGQPVSMFIIFSTGQSKVELHWPHITIQELVRMKETKSYNSTPITMSIPKFEIETEYDLASMMESRPFHNISKGVPESTSGIFSGRSYVSFLQNNYNFSLPQLNIKGMVQKASIKLTEKGCEAAVVTRIHHSDQISNKTKVPCARNRRLDNGRVHDPFNIIIGTTGAHPVNLFTGRFGGLSNC